jgi:hypothetical protein
MWPPSFKRIALTEEPVTNPDRHELLFFVAPRILRSSCSSADR